MTFWISGEPGIAVIVKVNAPKAIVPGISLLGISASLNKIFANGYNIKATTNKETPPYVKSAPDRTMARITLSFPSFVVINDAIDLP